MQYIKNIGLDLRFLKKNDYYSNFIFKLISKLISETPEYFYTIYLPVTFSNLNFGENSVNSFPMTKNGSLKEQISFQKKLNKDSNDLVIFFNYFKPISYKKPYILFLKSLQHFHFPKNSNFLTKFFEDILVIKNIKNASKIVVFDKESKEELNDKFNIFEGNIETLMAFFDEQKDDTYEDKLIDIKTKYNIKGEFFIYNAGNGNSKNLSQIIEIFKHFKIEQKNLNLVILDEETIKDIDFRKQVINNDLVDTIHFIGEINNIEKDLFYKETLGIIYPVLYSSFPFCLEDSIKYKNNIFASNLKNIKEIFGKNINYFNPNNTNDIIKILTSTKITKPNFSNILKKYNIEKTSNDLKNIIKEV